MSEDAGTERFEPVGASSDVFGHIVLAAMGIVLMLFGIGAYFDSHEPATIFAILFGLCFTGAAVGSFIEYPNLALWSERGRLVVDSNRPWRRWREEYPWDAVGEPYVKVHEGHEANTYEALVKVANRRLCLCKSSRESLAKSEAARFRMFADKCRCGHAD